MHSQDASAPDMMGRLTSLHEERLDLVCRRIKAIGARRVLDLGCGSGSLLHRLLADAQFEEVVGLEASGQALAAARDLLDEHLVPGASRLRLLRGSYAEAQAGLSGYDAAAMVETIEHVPPSVLSRVETAVFGRMRPAWMFLTTPNREYNPLFDMAPGQFRERDHKFEWDRARFRKWARGVAGRNSYRVTFSGIGEQDPELGPPSQMATFERLDTDVDAVERLA